MRSLALLMLSALACANAFVAPAMPMHSRAVAASSTQGISMISHGKGFRKLSRPADQRKALLRGLTTEVIRNGKITTTLARAKELRKPVDHMITLAKDGSLHARRQAMAYMYDKQLVHAMFEQVPDRYVDREGGYTRVLKDGFRRGDNAEMAIIELV